MSYTTSFLTCKTNELYYTSLIMWANWIETGNPNMSAQTALKCKRPNEVNILSDEQMQLVLRLKEEAHKALNL